MNATATAVTGDAPRRWTLRWLIGATRYAVIRIRTRLMLEAAIAELPQTPPPAAVRYRFGNAGDIDRLQLIDPAYDEPAKRVAKQRLASGDWLVIGECDGHPIFSHWVRLGAIEAGPSRRSMRVSPMRAYCYRLYTADAYRGRGVASGAYQFIVPKLAAQGCTRVVCWVSDRNTASVSFHRRSGFVPIATIYEIRLFGCWTFHWWGPHLRRYLRAAR